MIDLPDLKNERTVFLAIGNIMRADDGFGPLVYEELKPYERDNFIALNGGELPENMTSVIKEFDPDCLIMADAALLPEEAPDLKIINEADISNPSLSTHSLPLNVMIRFIKEDLPDLKIIFIAAKARKTDFDDDMTPSVTKAVKTASRAIIKALNG